jgi:hypothetical protein
MNYCTPVCPGHREETGAERVYQYFCWVRMLIASKEEYAEISTIAHPPYTRSLTRPETDSELVVIGAPFDTAVSFCSGVSLDPRVLCMGVSHQTSLRDFHPHTTLIPHIAIYPAHPSTRL